jgi:ABC-2 type transport system ATP-binding protein
LAGPKAAVESFTEDKEVIHREPFGNMVTATVMGHWNAGERKQAEALGLELAPVSLQQLIIYLTNGKTPRKAVEV